MLNGESVFGWLKVFAVLVVLALIGYLVYKLPDWLRNLFKFTTDSVLPKVNPVSDQNLAYQASNAMTEAITGQKNETFGGWLYSVTHKDPMEAMADAEALRNQNKPPLTANQKEPSDITAEDILGNYSPFQVGA